LRSVGEKLERAEEKKAEIVVERRKKAKRAIKKVFRVKGKKRKVTPKKRQVGVKRLLGAFGVVGGAGTQAGPGRPKGTYKYSMPIHEYKKLQSRKKALYSEYQREQIMKLRRRGVSPEQIQQLQLRRTMEEGLPPPTRRLQDEPEQMVDDELAFKKFEADNSLSPSAQALLTRLRRTQNLGKMANIRQQRIQKERRMLSEKGNLMKAHENMIPVRIDFTGVSENNILKSRNIFLESAENNILRKREGSRHILDVSEENNIMIPKRRQF